MFQAFLNDGELAPGLVFGEPRLSLLYPQKEQKNIYNNDHRDKKQLVTSFKDFQGLSLSLSTK